MHYINYNFNAFCEINDSFILVDFGCGDGSTLDKLNICKNKIGIEMDPNIFNLALQNTIIHFVITVFFICTSPYYKIYIIYVSGIEKLLDDQFFRYFDFTILHKKI